MIPVTELKNSPFTDLASVDAHQQLLHHVLRHRHSIDEIVEGGGQTVLALHHPVDTFLPSRLFPS